MQPPIFSPPYASHVSIIYFLFIQTKHFMLMLENFTIQVPRMQAEYLYGLASSQRLFTMQVTDSWRVSILQQLCKCMHNMYAMYYSFHEDVTELCR